jgi:hypothetical protein
MVRGGVADRAGQARRVGFVLARELTLPYDTAWLMAQKLCHGLSERSEYHLDGRTAQIRRPAQALTPMKVPLSQVFTLLNRTWTIGSISSAFLPPSWTIE